MSIKRGAREVGSVGRTRTFQFLKSDGRVAFTLIVDGDLYSAERLSGALARVERTLLDPVDPPLALVADELHPRPLPRQPDDPYQTGPLKLV